MFVCDLQSFWDHHWCLLQQCCWFFAVAVFQYKQAFVYLQNSHVSRHQKSSQLPLCPLLRLTNSRIALAWMQSPKRQPKRAASKWAFDLRNDPSWSFRKSKCLRCCGGLRVTCFMFLRLLWWFCTLKFLLLTEAFTLILGDSNLSSWKCSSNILGLAIHKCLEFGAWRFSRGFIPISGRQRT